MCIKTYVWLAVIISKLQLKQWRRKRHINPKHRLPPSRRIEDITIQNTVIWANTWKKCSSEDGSSAFLRNFFNDARNRSKTRENTNTETELQQAIRLHSSTKSVIELDFRVKRDKCKTSDDDDDDYDDDDDDSKAPRTFRTIFVFPNWAQ